MDDPSNTDLGGGASGGLPTDLGLVGTWNKFAVDGSSIKNGSSSLGLIVK